MRVCDYIKHCRKNGDHRCGRSADVYMPKVTPLTPIGVSGAATVMDGGCAKNEGGLYLRGSGGPKVFSCTHPVFE